MRRWPQCCLRSWLQSWLWGWLRCCLRHEQLQRRPRTRLAVRSLPRWLVVRRRRTSGVHLLLLAVPFKLQICVLALGLWRIRCRGCVSLALRHIWFLQLSRRIAATYQEVRCLVERLVCELCNSVLNARGDAGEPSPH